MAEEEQDGIGEKNESEFPLHSDFERFGILLLTAQNLGMENTNLNPAIIREYYSVLHEIWRFLSPIVGRKGTAIGVAGKIKEYDTISRVCKQRLLLEKNFKVPLEVFEALSELHQELLNIKQEANLGVKVRKRYTEEQKLDNVLT